MEKMKFNFKEKIAIMVFFQLIIIFSLIFFNFLTISSGKEVLIEIEYLRKQSKFGQEYLDIKYSISSLEKVYENELQKSDIVYVVLEKNLHDDFYGFKSIQKNKPNEGVFIKGKVNYKSYCPDLYNKHGCLTNIIYGIESFFMPNMDSFDLDDDKYAKILIDKNGGATLKEVYINNKKL